MFCKLELFRYPQALHPEYHSLRRSGNYELPTPGSRDLLIGEKILQLDRARHADGLKPVTRLPVPQPERRTDFVRVETLVP
jgi:hypothetical protein